MLTVSPKRQNLLSILPNPNDVDELLEAFNIILGEKKKKTDRIEIF